MIGRRVPRKIAAFHHVHQPLEDAVGVRADHHVLRVASEIGVRRNDAREVASGALAQLLEHIVFWQRAFHHVEDGFVQRDIHDLALACVGFPMAQRHEHADDAVQRSQRVADRKVGPHRRPVGETGDVAQSTHRFADRAEPRLIAVRPGLPESREPEHDDARIPRRKLLVAEPPFFQCPRPEILDDHIGILCQPAHDPLPFGGPQIDGDRFLVPVLHVPPQRGALVDFSPVAQRIALGRLDLDDFGAELREEFPGKGPGNQLSQLDHLQPFQGFCHSSLRSTKACARVPVSTYSSSPPTGTPRAIRVIRKPRPLSISLM